MPSSLNSASCKTSKARFGPRAGVAYRFSDKWVARAGYGLTNDPYEGMELIRANYPLLIQVKLQSPNGLTPATSLSKGIPTVQAPAQGNGILNIPSDYAWQGYPKDLDRGYIQSWNVTVQRELPWHFKLELRMLRKRIEPLLLDEFPTERGT